jgi:hypothetical protein
VTDHDRFTEDVPGDDNLILLGGTEISLVAPKSGGPLHVLGIGITAMPAVSPTSSLRETIDAISAAGGIAFVAHPVWSGLRTDEVDGIELAAGIEIFNSSCDVEQDRAHADAHWDLWLSMGLRLGGIATDDLHYPGYEAFRGWTMVHARERSREAVLEALASGRYFATTGPRFQQIDIQNQTITIRSTPVRSVAALANPPFGARVNAGHHELTFYGQRLSTPDGQVHEGIIDGDLLTGARFGVHPAVSYARFVIQDDRGRRAWTNPIYRRDK